MYSYALLLITLFQLVTSSPDGNFDGVATASINATTKSTDDGIVFESGYVIHPGIGALKFQKSMLDWNDARDACIKEGAHLAVINSALEESIIAKYQAESGMISSWVGYHDQFKKDDWVTVLDQPINAVGYLHWSVGEPNNNGGDERCVSYDRTGLNDQKCSAKNSFVCKLYLK